MMTKTKGLFLKTGNIARAQGYLLGFPAGIAIAHLVTTL